MILKTYIKYKNINNLYIFSISYNLKKWKHKIKRIQIKWWQNVIANLIEHLKKVIYYNHFN